MNRLNLSVLIKTFVEYGDAEGLEKVVDSDTAGVFVEPIQGEAVVIIPPERLSLRAYARSATTGGH